MTKAKKPIYSPSLRMKAGEIAGVSHLSADVADCVLPRFIVPPHGERDERQFILIETDRMPDISRSLSGAWRERPVLIDATYILDEYGRERIADWLPQMFHKSWKAGVRAIPVAMLDDISEVEALAYRSCALKSESIKFAISVRAADMAGTGFRSSLAYALELLDLDVTDCAVIADFSGSEFSQPQIVAPIIGAALETLQDVGPWQLVIFQGTNFPEHNPAQPDSVEIWPRHEWKAWCAAVNFQPETAEHMIFGDFAADCSKMKFSKGRSQAIRHLRYTSGPDWLIQRAGDQGSDKIRMQGVAKKIVESGRFAGSSFSQADAFIEKLAQGSTGPGTAKDWRQLNTTHHITAVVRDIAKVRGISILEREVSKVPEQFLLLQ
jgi:Beta protein